jgi:hypothetical protein
VLKNELSNVKLPFRIDESIQPEIVPYNKIPKELIDRLSKQGNVKDVGGYYNQGENKIYLFQKKPDKLVIEHEKAHAQIGMRNQFDPRSSHLVEDELKAVLLAYKRTGQPQSLFNWLSEMNWGMLNNHALNEGKKTPWKYNYSEMYDHSVNHLKGVVNKYIKYFPEQWKKDWEEQLKFINDKDDIGAKHFPKGDFMVLKTPSGDIITLRRDVASGKDNRGKFYKINDDVPTMTQEIKKMYGKNAKLFRVIEFDKKKPQLKRYVNRVSKHVPESGFRAFFKTRQGV